MKAFPKLTSPSECLDPRYAEYRRLSELPFRGELTRTRLQEVIAATIRCGQLFCFSLRFV
jgi:hypothetical protein